MKVEPFLVEKWMNKYEHKVEINCSETCVKPFTLGEFLSLMEQEDFFKKMWETQLTYGYIPGSKDLRIGIANLYQGMDYDNILITGGAIGANFLVFYSLVEPGDTVISVSPTYQQLYSVAKSFGANVKILKLKMKEKWLPDPEKIKDLVDNKTKLIVINNPNNPTGSLITDDLLKEICEITEDAGAYLLDDESYRGVYVDSNMTVQSVVEHTEKGIATGSFSKPFSLTGLRLGWIVAQKGIISLCEDRRDYTTISNGIIDDALATIAVQNVEKIKERNQEIIDRNFLLLSEWVKNEPLIDWVPPQGGTIAFLNYKMKIPSEELCLRLIKEKDVLLVPGICFGMEGFLRIGWGGNTETLKEGLERLGQFFNQFND